MVDQKKAIKIALLLLALYVIGYFVVDALNPNPPRDPPAPVLTYDPAE